MEGSHIFNLSHVTLTTSILGVNLLCVGYYMLYSMRSPNRKFLTLTIPKI